MNNPAYSGTSQEKAEPVNEGKYKLHDRVRIRVGSIRPNAVYMQDLAGCIAVVDRVMERPHCPYHLAGITHWFYEDELEKVHNIETGKALPTVYVEKNPLSGNRPVVLPKPPVEYIVLKELAE